mmetsp:Transcript_31749/g.72942  ORF Transcript_31749/g.72942 Transcript_31749/m.72942 type:complete len:81 (+) Transcript_31749:203-445(+)
MHYLSTISKEKQGHWFQNDYGVSSKRNRVGLQSCCRACSKRSRGAFKRTTLSGWILRSSSPMSWTRIQSEYAAAKESSSS